MASLQLRGNSFRILFKFDGKLVSFPIGEVDEREATAWKGKIEHLLLRLKQRLLDLPDHCDITTFLRHDGKPPQANSASQRKDFTILNLRDEYLAAHDGILDPCTIAGMKIHWKHLVRLLKSHLFAEPLATADLQAYIVARVQEGVEGGTAKKEMVTLRTCWNWAMRMDKITKAFPNKGLRYPKGKEKPPFITFAEAEVRIAAGEADILWESVFLTTADTAELLEDVKKQARHPWIYPMFCFAAHTGARRSEMLRVLLTDVRLTEGAVLIREKKRRRDVEVSFRRVPLSPSLAATLSDWIGNHPGGPHLFCHAGTIPRSRKRSRTTGHQADKTRPKTLAGRMASVKDRAATEATALSRTEASDHFNRTLAGTKWENLSGWHALRHSFASNCAAKGIDQRLIDGWLGHTTEEMRRRYRHLIPSVEQSAINSVFA